MISHDREIVEILSSTSIVKSIVKIDRKLESSMRTVVRCWLPYFWLPALLLTPASAATADETFVSAVLDCKSLSPADERLACYDRIVDAYSGSGAERETANPTESAAVDAEALFGMSPVAAQRALEESTGREQIDRVEATIVTLTAVAPNKVAVVLDNGQIWRQTTASSLKLAEGDDIVIRRRSLGSHTLQKAGAARSMKVKRVE